MNIVHKGWNWENIDSDSWLNVSEEFLPVALKWKNKYHTILDIAAGKGRHALFSYNISYGFCRGKEGDR